MKTADSPDTPATTCSALGGLVISSVCRSAARGAEAVYLSMGGPVSTRTLSSDTLGMCCVKYEDGAGRSNERNYDYDNDGGAVTLVGASCRLIKGEPDANGRRDTIRRGPPSGTATTIGRDLAPRRGAAGLANCQRSQQRSRIMRPMGMRPGT